MTGRVVLRNVTSIDDINDIDVVSNDCYEHRYMRYRHAIDIPDIKFPLRNSRIENVPRSFDTAELRGP